MAGARLLVLLLVALPGAVAESQVVACYAGGTVARILPILLHEAGESDPRVPASRGPVAYADPANGTLWLEADGEDGLRREANLCAASRGPAFDHAGRTLLRVLYESGDAPLA